MHQKNIILFIGTPTSLIFSQEPDISQLHVLKDCSNHALGHELVPIVTSMADNNQMLPEMLDNLPQVQMLPSGQQCIVSNVLTGVYTLPEEPEDIEENTTM